MCNYIDYSDVLATNTHNAKVQYSYEVEDALLLHLEMLRRLLLHNPESVNSALVPAKATLDQMDKQLTNPWICQFVGRLLFIEPAQINNWFELYIALGDSTTQVDDIHARTLFTIHQLSTTKTPKKQSTELDQA